MDFSEIVAQITRGFAGFTWGNAIMIAAGLGLMTLAVVKEYEPVLLLPIGFGCVLANVGMSTQHGIFKVLYDAGIASELFPLLIFIGVGAMIDFRPLLAMPQMALLGAAGQFGIYGTLLLALALGFPLNQAASIGVIGAIDGPTAIFVTTKLAPEILAPVAVAAYSYMSLIPIIQVPVMKWLTTRKERLIRMEYAPRPVPRSVVIVFPIAVTVAVSLIAPDAAPLIATLMLGNLLRESGVVERLSKAAQNEIINVATLFLGLTIGATMTAQSFLNARTLMILGLGFMAFVLDTVAGLLFGKLMAFITRGKVNPLIGACGISAFPMAGRLAAQVAKEEDFDNFILMHAMGANTAGQLGSVIAGGLLLALTLGFLH
ncbi:MAG: sodium ion-translocating decarboxylase subunit beta [Thermanaerothrix sp.]|jgi:oxaloacetate decarboxylase beta subunit|uniref:Sodium ion-translocating decarboxylase subunit beta n=2 Tax=Thermanaerothrix TaxID=1077886 RepID=A0ABU3NQ45_9CHLR|nr:sodium ion-translocating decarboxylase subunit beta [Thermanaerothrix sp. 4228-RoL]MDT8898961.1 sodium ion-translocating decarboxylase subunit beta [Thermanaerothrix sp. 4228-RoL]